VPESVVTELRESLEDTADSLMASVRCVAEGLENGSGPETCRSSIADTTEATIEVAERLLPLVPYGSRSDTEVLALFS
jgi:dissimilatory sulfite reductase (desulfoviridin) alpha/beta subunit